MAKMYWSFGELREKRFLEGQLVSTRESWEDVLLRSGGVADSRATGVGARSHGACEPSPEGGSYSSV